MTKMKIFQNLTERLSWEQFSPLGEGISYPEMYLLCLSMRLRKISVAGCVFSRRPTWLVETEIQFFSRQAILYRTTAMQIERKRTGGFEGKYFTKM